MTTDSVPRKSLEIKTHEKDPPELETHTSTFETEGRTKPWKMAISQYRLHLHRQRKRKKERKPSRAPEFFETQLAEVIKK
jgi:hypothetical protein